MFWKKRNKATADKEGHFPHPYRFCHIYISYKYNQVLFVPYGKTGNGSYSEVDNLIIDSWPCKFGDLQTNIEEVLKRFLDKHEHVKGKWPSYEKSKAPSQKSFESDYIDLRLETDMARSYEEGEVERIRVSAQP